MTSILTWAKNDRNDFEMIFRELSNVAFRFSLRRPGAEIMGGRSNAPPPSRRWKIQRPSRARVNPRRHRGGGWCNPPLRFFWNIFFVNRTIVTIFSIAFRPSFYVPPENFKTLTPLTFDLWRHNWGHVRRKMRSVAHNLQTLSFLLAIWMWTCSTK